MGKALDGALPLVEVLWRRERDLEPVDTPERQAGLEKRLMQAASTIQDGAVKGAYERELKARMRDHLWQVRSANRAKRPMPQRGGQVAAPVLRGGPPAKTRGLGLVVRAVDHHHLVEIGFEALAVAFFPDPDVSAIRDALISENTTDSGVDRATLSNHLEGLGKLRAAELLTKYPDIPNIPQGGSEEREWLIALEQYARPDGADEAGRISGEAFATAEDAGHRHRIVSERRARTARLNEAAEKADQS